MTTHGQQALIINDDHVQNLVPNNVHQNFTAEVQVDGYMQERGLAKPGPQFLGGDITTMITGAWNTLEDTIYTVIHPLDFFTALPPNVSDAQYRAVAFQTLVGGALAVAVFSWIKAA